MDTTTPNEAFSTNKMNTKRTSREQNMDRHAASFTADEPSTILAQQEQQHRRDRSGDEYHVRACQCDLTNKCITSQFDSRMTRQTELFVCLHTESRAVEFVEVLNLTLTGNSYESQPITSGIPNNPHQTWITKDGGAWTIRTRMDSEFFTTVLPSSKDLTVVAEGVTVLRKIEAKVQRQKDINKAEKDKKVENGKKAAKDKKAKHAKHNTHATVPPVRFLQDSNANVNVSVPFRVDILVQPDESLAEDYFVNYAPIVLMALVFGLCCLSVACRMRAERIQRRANRHLAESPSSNREGEKLPTTLEEIYDDEKDEFDDEPTFVSPNSPFEENIAQIRRV